MRPQAPAPRQSEVEAYVRTCYADLENKIESIVAMAVEEMSSPEPGGSGSAPPSPGAAPPPPVALQRRLEETVEMYDPPADGAVPLPEAVVDVVEAQQAAVAAARQQAAATRQQRRSSADDAAARAADFQRFLDRALSGSAAAGPRHTAPPGTGPYAQPSALAGSSKFPGHQSQHAGTNPKMIASLVPREAAAIQRHIQRHNSQQSPPRMGRPPADSNAATSLAILSQRRAKSAPRARATEPSGDGRPAYVRLSSYGRKQLEGRSTAGDPEWVVDMRRRARRMSEGERTAAADRLYREAERRRAEFARKQEAEARRWRDRARSVSPGRMTGTWGGTTSPRAAGYDRPRSAGGTGYFGSSGWMHASFVDRQWADVTRRLEKQREIEEAKRAAEQAPPDPKVYTLKPQITGLATRVQPHSPEQQMLWVAERRGKAMLERAKEEEQELKGLCFMPRINQRSRQIALQRWAHDGADPRRPWTANPTVTAPPKYKQYIPEEWLRYGSPTERAERRKQELVDHAVRSLRGTMAGGGGTSGGGSGAGMAYGTERYDASAWLSGGGSGRGGFAAASGAAGYGQTGPAPGEFQGNYNRTGYEAAWPGGTAAAPATAAGREAWPSPEAAATAAGSAPAQAVVPVAPGDGVAFVQINLPSGEGTREPPHLQEALSPQQTPQPGQFASAQLEQERVQGLPEETAAVPAPPPHATVNPLSLTAAWRSARAATAATRSSGGGSGTAFGGASMGGTPPSFSAAITPTVSGGGSGAAVLHQFAAVPNHNKLPSRASTSGGGVPGAAAQALRALLQSGLPLQPTLSEALHQALVLAEAEDAKAKEEEDHQEEQLHRELWDLEQQQAQLKLAQKEMTSHAQPYTSSVNYYALQQQVQEREAALLRQRQAPPGGGQQRAFGKSESQRARYLNEVAAAQAAAGQAQPAGAYYIATNRVQPAGGAAAMLRKSTSKKGASAAVHRQGGGADSSALDDATILGFLLQQQAAVQEGGEPTATAAAVPWGLAPPGARRSSAGGLASSPSAPPPTEPYSRAQIVNALRRSTSGGMDSGRSGASSGSGAGVQRAAPSQAGAWQHSTTSVAALRSGAAPSSLQACDSSAEMASEGQQVVSKAAVDAALFGTRLETISGPYELSDSPRVPGSGAAGTPASLTVRPAAWGPGQRTGSRGASDASRDIEAGLVTASPGASRVPSDPASLMEVVVDAPFQPAAAIAYLLGEIDGDEAGGSKVGAAKEDAAEQPPSPGSPKQAAGPVSTVVRAFAARLSKLSQPAAAAAAASGTAATAAPDMIVFSPAPAAVSDAIPAGPLAVASGPAAALADQSEASIAADTAAAPVAAVDEDLAAPPRSRAASIEAQLSSCLFDEQLTPDARARIMADIFRRSMGGATPSQGVVEALVQTAELLTSAAAAAPGVNAEEAAIAAAEALEGGQPQGAATEPEASADVSALQQGDGNGPESH